MRRLKAKLLVIAGLTISTTASANGRFPEAQVIESVPGSDGSTVFLRTTFGVLVSRDTGKHWRWMCERALGYEGQWDPPIAVTRDARLWVGLEDGLASTKDGCDVDRAAELTGETVKDMTVDADGALWAITGQPGKSSVVWRKKIGKAFERLASLGEMNAMTIEVAPSRASRVYVSGQPYATIRGQIYRSDDGGNTFRTELGDGGASFASGQTADGPFFIGAVDRDDPSRLLVRHLHAQGSEVLLSKDGGRTFANVLSMKSAMFGFARSPDGKELWAASGLPEHGIFHSLDRGEHFEPLTKHGVLCLHAATPDLLYLCENALSLGAPAVALTRDDAMTITPLARFADVEGPTECATPDARASLCAGVWPAMKDLFTVGPAAGADAGGPVRDAGTAPPARASGSKCGCDIIGAWAPDRAWPAGLLALIAWGRRRRRRGSDGAHSAW